MPSRTASPLRTRPRPILAAVGVTALTLALACSGSGKTAPPPLESRTLSGTYAEARWSSEYATKFNPRLLANFIVAAQTANGPGWDVYAGVGHNDGTYQVPEAPEGEHWLRMDYGVSGAFQDRTREFVWTDQAVVDFNWDLHLSRNEFDPTIRLLQGASLAFNATGLAPVQATDQFALVVPQADTLIGGAYYMGKTTDLFSPWSDLNLPAEGATALTGTEISYWTGSIIKATDQATLLQIRQRTQKDLLFQAIVKVANLPVFTLSDGDAAKVDGILFTEAKPLPYALDWPRSAWAPLKDQVGGVNAVVDSTEVMVGAMVNGTAKGRVQYDYNLFEVPLFAPLANRYFPDTFEVHGGILPEGTADLATEDLGLQNPFPASWLFEHYQMNFQSEVGPAGTPWTSWIGFDRPLGAPGPITPLLTPIRTPTVNGQALDQTRLGVGATPILAWAAPKVGTPTSYEVSLIDWSLASANGAGVLAVTLWVPGDLTQVRLPHDVLLAGHPYSLRITAHAMAGQDVRKAPHRMALPHAYATFLTAVFSR